MPFGYKDNIFCLQSQSKSWDVLELAKAQEGPFYLYDLDEMAKRLRFYKECFSENSQIHYAMKANSHPLLLKKIAELNLGVDVVSSGEIQLAIDCGIQPENIVFSGVGKSIKEINLALHYAIKQLNVESPEELKRIGQLAKNSGKVARVAFRMNPDVDPDTHPYIKTGFRDNKFGMDNSFIPQLEALLKEYSESLSLVGLTLHIGSQITELKHFLDAIKKTIPIHRYLKDNGHKMETFDIGGGVGISYTEDNGEDDYLSIKNYSDQVKKLLEALKVQILCEPGRIITGRSGVLVTDIQYIKESPFKNFAIVSSGMHHLLRPSLYRAHHRIEPLDKGPRPTKLYDIVGPICESSDVLGFDRQLPLLQQGDWLVIRDTGAYGIVMANTYNAHELPKEIVVTGDQVIFS